MKRLNAGRILICTFLLGMLAASGYLGAVQNKPVRSVVVPIAFEPLENGKIAAISMQKTEDRLKAARAEALAMLEEVIADPKASQKAADLAFAEKTRIAAAMESEARLEAAIHALGIEGAKALRADNMLTVFLPPKAALDDRVRMQIVDAAAAATGVSAESIKIILAKNE